MVAAPSCDSVLLRRPVCDRTKARYQGKVDDGIWLVSSMHYDLGYFDLEQKILQPLDNPFGKRLSPMSYDIGTGVVARQHCRNLFDPC